MNNGKAAMHVREYRSPLAAGEKRVLIWLAERMPPFVNSDHLTLLGFFGILSSGIGFWVSAREVRALFLVIAGLAVNWFGDSLDGTLARVRSRQRPRYGYYTDHVLDLIGTAILVIGMALSGFMSPLVALGFLVAYLLVMAEVFLSTHVQRVFRMSFMGFGPTELRILLAIGTLFLFRKPVVRIAGAGPFLLFDVGGIVSIAGLTLALLVSAFRNIRALYREEPLSR
jgi:archaetidylinositol phosphate synthase